MNSFVKNPYLLVVVLFFWSSFACSESPEPSGSEIITLDTSAPLSDKLIRIQGGVDGTVTLVTFEWEGDLLIRQESSESSYEYFYRDEILDHRVHTVFGEEPLTLQSDYVIENGRLIEKLYTDFNYYRNNRRNSQGLMLQKREERYVIGSQLRIDYYFYRNDLEQYEGYSTYDITPNGNLTNLQHFDESGDPDNSGFLNQGAVMEEVMNPTNFSFFGSDNFYLTDHNYRFPALFEHHRDYRLTINGLNYPTEVSGVFVDPDSGEENPYVNRYFYQD